MARASKCGKGEVMRGRLINIRRRAVLGEALNCNQFPIKFKNNFSSPYLRVFVVTTLQMLHFFLPPLAF